MKKGQNVVLPQLSIDQVAQLLGIHERHVRRLIKRHGLPTWKAGGRVLIDPQKLREWIDAGGTAAPRKEAAV